MKLFVVSLEVFGIIIFYGCMKVVSLGGVGGCPLAQALRSLNYPAGPYDWLLTTQSFIENSFDNYDNFFKFDESFVYTTGILLAPDKKALMIHDFVHFESQKDGVVEKYKRRFLRLRDTLRGNDDILFVRHFDNIAKELKPLGFYNDLLIRDDEDLLRWDKFVTGLQSTTTNKIKLLVITDQEDTRVFENVIVKCLKERNPQDISDSIQETTKKMEKNTTG